VRLLELAIDRPGKRIHEQEPSVRRIFIEAKSIKPTSSSLNIPAACRCFC